MSATRMFAPQGAQVLKSKNITIATHQPTRHDAQELLSATLSHFRVRNEANRTWLSGPILTDRKTFFIKSTELSSFPSRARVTLNLKRTNGLYDWPIAELHNNIAINKLTEHTPTLIGHAIRTNCTGLVKDVVLIFEHLNDHIDGLQWIKENPTQISELIKSTMEFIISLNNKGIIHLDLWARNVMLPENEPTTLKLIDLENCMIGHTRFPSETLGFQFGFLFQHTLKNHISEDKYNLIVEEALPTEDWFQRSRFEKYYHYFKHTHASRKERKNIINRGYI